MTETWIPFAIRHPGPSYKQGYPGVPSIPLNEKEGEVKHSAEGSLVATLSMLGGQQTSSWHGTLAKDGRLFQHYPLESITWHAGLPGDRRQDTSLIGNLTLLGWEHEGGGPNAPGEPLTEAQYQTTLRLSQFVREKCLLVALRPPTLRRNLWEHNWLTATSCPSGRIPWTRLIQDLQEDEMLDDQDKQWLGALGRNIVKAITEGPFPSVLQGDPTYTNAKHDLADVLRAITAVQASGGLSEAQIRGIVREELNKTKLGA